MIRSLRRRWNGSIREISKHPVQKVINYTDLQSQKAVSGYQSISINKTSIAPISSADRTQRRTNP